MTRRHRVISSLSWVVSTLVVVFAVVISPASAATATQSGGSVTGAGNGIKISPVRSELTINPGESVTIDVLVTNVTSQTASFQIIPSDFVASGDESGDPAIILDANQSAPSHGLKQYIKPISNVTIGSQQVKDVKVVINIPTKAIAGGYYGAIRVAPAGSSATKTTNLALSANVASLVLVKVPGNIHEVMSLASFGARTGNEAHTIFSSGKGISAVVRFQNEGDIQEQPFGKILLKNFHGKVIGTYEVNNTDPRGNVLPDSVRRFSLPLKGIGSFGRYTLEGNFGYGSNGQLLSAKSTFYVLPLPVLFILIALIIAIVVGLFELPRVLKRYNRRVLRRAGRL